jgi:squalene synthase HpnC
VTAEAPPAASDLHLARTRPENFPVLSRLVPGELRLPLARVYAFARTTDDLGDEPGRDPAERLASLDAWEAGLRAALRDGAARAAPPLAGTTGPAGAESLRQVLRATAETILDHRLELQPFLDLIEANRFDQKRLRYERIGDLLESCRLSANPVGRIVLRLFGRDVPALHASSDALCTGLQIANHVQGVGEDLRLRGRIYLPLEDLERFGVVEADLRTGRVTPGVRDLLRFEIARARALLERGRGLPDAFAGRRRAVLRLCLRGGRGILDRLESRLDDVLQGRVRVPRATIAAWIAAEGVRAWAADGWRGRW